MPPDDPHAELREIAIDLMTALDMLDGMVADAPPERRAPSPRSVHSRVTSALERVNGLLADGGPAGS